MLTSKRGGKHCPLSLAKRFLLATECALNRAEITNRACTENHQAERGEKCKHRQADFNKENEFLVLRPNNAECIKQSSHSNLNRCVTSLLSLPKITSQVKVDSEAHVVCWPASLYDYSRCMLKNETSERIVLVEHGEHAI